MNISVRKSKLQGKGVFSLKSFKKGEYIHTIDDNHIVNDESKLTANQHEYDLDYLVNKTILMQPPEKYINHSCEPNCYVKTEKGIRHIYAMRDINKGEEITYDYSMNGDNEGTFRCNCGSKSCRGVYQGSFFKLPVDIQKKYIPYLDKWFLEKYKDRINNLR